MISGSNQWKLRIDRNGIKIYTLKTPGSSNVKIKGVTTYKYKLSQMVAAFFDESIQDDCESWVPGCIEYKILKPWDSKRQTTIQLWKLKLFPPFSNRELLLQGELYQDKQSKEIIIENTAVPNKIPPHDGFVRLSHVHNVWRYIPQENGETRVEFIQDMDMGGLFPDFLINLGGPYGIYELLAETTPKMMKNEKYLMAKYDFIEELEIQQEVTAN
jgi:hypothetical protein